MIDSAKATRIRAFMVFLCLGLLVASCLLVYNTFSVRNIAEDVSHAYPNWIENRFAGAHKSLLSLLKRIDGCLTEAPRKSEMYKDLGMACILAAKLSDQITYEDAILCLDKALLFTDDKFDLASLNREKALCYSLSGKYDAAEKLYAQVVQTGRRFSDSQQADLIYALTGQGTNFAAENKFELADNAFNEALTLANSRNISSAKPRLLYELARVAEKTGDLTKAHDFYARTLKSERTAFTQLDRIGLMSLVHDESVLEQLGKTTEAQNVPRQVDEVLY